MSKQPFHHSFQSEVTSAPPSRVMWAYIAIGAILAAALACELSVLFVYGLPGPSGWSFAYAFYLLPACLAGLLAGWFFWGLFIVKPRRATLGRGVLLGVLSSLLAHPLTWLLIWLASTIPSMSIQMRFDEVIWNTVISWEWVGWITALIGGTAGGLLLSCQRAMTR